MRAATADVSGIDFVTDRGLRGFITRGALQDLARLSHNHRWTDLQQAFDHHAAEIERFAHSLQRNGMLEDDRAVITPNFVAMC